MERPWLDGHSLCVSYPSLFDISQAQDWSFEKVLSNNCVIPFRRRFLPLMEEQWRYITECAARAVINDTPDRAVWSLNTNGRFSTKSMYQFLEKDLAGANNKWIWKAKLPLKIKIFLWQLFRNAILTRDNLVKRNWLGNPKCSFCQQNETAVHLFFGCSNAKTIWGTLGSVLGTATCPRSLWQCIVWLHKFVRWGKQFHMLILASVCWAIWITRNEITFDKKVVRSPLVIIYTMCSFLRYWAGLYGNDDSEKIKEGADQLMYKAAMLAGHVSGSRGNAADGGHIRLLLTG